MYPPSYATEESEKNEMDESGVTYPFWGPVVPQYVVPSTMMPSYQQYPHHVSSILNSSTSSHPDCKGVIVQS